MTAHEASSSSSSKSKLWNYDVFLSFRGEDTRKGFTGHLHAALKDRGYQAYMDEDDLNRGEEIKEELFRAIVGSRISIIVFSKGYADSSWCLDELMKIMECKSKLGRHVLPIFYHVDPSHVRKQDGDLAKAFHKHKKGISKVKDGKKREAKRERVKQWRKALTEAANLSGHHLQITDNGCEAKFIRKIVNENICEWLTSTNEFLVDKHQVGIESRIQDIITYLSSGGSNDVLMVGIWGMGGLGKTTVAKAIYNKIHPEFEFKSFLDDISNTTSRHGLVYLQETLVSDILKSTKSSIRSVDGGKSLIKQHFRHRRILVIMDNIDDEEQLNAIAGNHDWFGPESRIIITTRNEHLLKHVEVDKTYPLQKLNEGEALELFSWHAFRKSCPDEEYLQLSKMFGYYCGGLPLALEVSGSFLFKRSLLEWESQLEKLKITSDEKIIKPLRISFDGLDDNQKAIFLDISCFFIGWDKDYVAKALDVCGFFATIGISVLRERCLVTVEDNKLNMHDLLREMARVIISVGHPGKWSRLWNHQEVAYVLRNKAGTEEVEGLFLDGLDFRYNKHPNFCTEAFANMKKLRLLYLEDVELNGEYKHLPRELMWLCWEGCRLKSIPDDFFNQEKLVILEMRQSNLVHVWEGYKLLQNLKIINLSHSYSLAKSPDFSQVPNLEELILEGCECLFEIHPSIGHLKRLSLVNLRYCRMLISLPRDFYKSKSVETLLLNGCSEFIELHEDIREMISLRTLEAEHTAIREVPPSIGYLKRLSSVNLTGCHKLISLPRNFYKLKSVKILLLNGCHQFRELHEDIGEMISLRTFEVEFTAIRELPSSIVGLKNLRSLFLPQSLICSLHYLNLTWMNFHILPNLSGLPKLETLVLNHCNNLHTVSDLPTSLKFLHASTCPTLETMPNFLEMSNMRQLNVRHSFQLTNVPGLDKSLNSMTRIDMNNCTNLTADFRKNILQGWTSCGFGGIFLCRNFVPNWFEFVSEGTKVSFDIPLNDGRTFEGLTLCFWCKYAHKIYGIAVINNTKHTELQASLGSRDPHFLWQGQLSNNTLKLESGDTVEVEVRYESMMRPASMRTMVNLVWNKPMKENIHDLDQAGYVFDPHPARFYGEAQLRW